MIGLRVLADVGVVAEVLDRDVQQPRDAEDARARMVDLRNLFARHEIETALYYLRRGAWVAALNRAKFCVENYDGAPSVRDAKSSPVSSWIGSASMSPRSSTVRPLAAADRCA